MATLMATFDIGDRIRLGVTFKDIADELSDPTEVTIKHRNSTAGSATAIYDGGAGAVVKDGTGAYHLDIDLDNPGRWYWRAQGDDTPEAAGERSFSVRASQFS